MKRADRWWKLQLCVALKGQPRAAQAVGLGILDEQDEKALKGRPAQFLCEKTVTPFQGFWFTLMHLTQTAGLGWSKSPFKGLVSGEAASETSRCKL